MQKVRLSNRDLEQIKLLFKHYFGDNDHLWLFGSRTDLTKRGGDIDLYVETCEASFDIAWDKRRDFWWEMQKALGEQKIDVIMNVLARKFERSIYGEAKSTGVMLI